MNRRQALAFGLFAGAAAWARAQPAKPAAKTMRVGLLRVLPLPATTTGPLHKTFVETLRELGWVEGRNIVYDPVDSGGDDSRLPEAAVALIARRPDVIYVTNGPTARAAFGATRTIPIVFHSVPDPVRVGLVKSLAQPGGNVTGVATFGGELGGRRMQLLKETLPRISRVGVLVSASATTSDEYSVIERAAGGGVKIFAATVKAPSDFNDVFAGLAANKAEALLVTQSAVFMRESKAILQLAAKHRIPVVGFRSEQAENGALMSYNSSLADHTRRAAHLVDRVLRGAKPADIPVEQPTNFELVINLKTAKALGITMPQSLLLQASRVIE